MTEILSVGAEGRTRTGTACATTPSRWRVYQFHHFGNANLKRLNVRALLFVYVRALLEWQGPY
jgi:hypothetical protein